MAIRFTVEPISATETARRISRSASNVRALAKAGKLAHVRTSRGGFLFDQDCVDEYVKTRDADRKGTTR